MSSSRMRRRLALTAATAAAVLTLGACATGPSQPSAATPSESVATTSEAPTTISAPTTPAPTTTVAPPEPTPTPEPTPDPTLNQPTVSYLKGPGAIGPGESAKVTIVVETPNPGIPFGDVTLKVDGAPYFSGTLNEAGHLPVTISGLAAGDHTYQAVFHGNTNYVAAESKVRALKVMTQAEIDAAKKKKEEEAAASAAAAAAGNPCPVTAEACIDLTNNVTWLQENGVITYGPVKQIAGRKGFRTPPGTFTVQWKNIDHKSSIYNDAPMPYAIFFNGGIAFHVGSLSTPSHGCIHLSESAAKAYWAALQPGDVVYVFGAASTY